MKCQRDRIPTIVSLHEIRSGCNSKTYDITEGQEKCVVGDLPTYHTKSFTLFPCFSGTLKRVFIANETMTVGIGQGFDGSPCASNDGFFFWLHLTQVSLSTAHICLLRYSHDEPIRFGGRGRIRTRDLRLRRPTHYPAVLHAQRCQNAPYDGGYCC